MFSINTSTQFSRCSIRGRFSPYSRYPTPGRPHHVLPLPSIKPDPPDPAFAPRVPVFVLEELIVKRLLVR
jgi:hypothetical protein